MAELNVGVVGVGVMGTYHAQIYAGLPGARLVGVADPDPLRRQVLERDLEVPAYADPYALIGKVDAVSVASPTSLHYEHVKTFLEAGVHVLVEKPMVPRLEEARHLAALAERKGLVLQVGHIMRFYRAVEEMPRLLRNPIVIEARRVGNNRRIRDIGVILDLMIHDLDVLLLLLRERPRRWQVVGHHLGAVEEYAHAVLEFPSGTKAVLTASRLSAQAERSLAITQEDEVIRMDFTNDPYTEVSIYRAAGEQNGKTEVQVARTSIHNENPLRRELKHFIDRILRGVEPIGTLEDDLTTLEIALALRQSLHEVVA
ncbi:Gfo/Idh/MocA family protein [Marinithermus hydrothermalis]|uniref:Oxidoreductase domain protein n=1 Tax=Marinithermus hydrothermalis (strain DSM 14884 / JCM 11576 / T1) TaxID=869210 RepID=F2NPZ5_MARHT|nr:Gfo/Idh/MocA family oxidoreductase [Marinithermus hydrothermalis]AEB11096.1 oxidoreductase domain protein [Marinithermus hydrothermalis DSM 14884]